MEENQNVPIDQEPVEMSGAVNEVTGGEVHFGPGAALTVSAQGNLDMERAGAMVAQANGNMDIKFGGASVLVAGNNLAVTNGVGSLLINGRDTEITNGGAQVMIVGRSATVNHGMVGFLLTRQANMGEGTKVVFNTPQAIAFGAALGVVLTLLRILFPTKGSKKGCC